ncbi:MAG: DUF4252 domain-containing protein [Flavobacteriaceae bacterium]|nr:DUF4252 domain-containing protein [Flavobacteriaceae bacterium]
MKRFITLIILLVFISCGSYNSINNFYHLHKNDANVTAIRMPQFMLSLLRNASPEMNSFIGNVRDIRYIQLSPQNDGESNRINNEINNLTSSKFIEVFRKNEDPVRTLISVRENKTTVKEIMIYKTAPKASSVFYLNGNFNPNTVRKYAKEGNFDKLSNTFMQQYNLVPEASLIEN